MTQSGGGLIYRAIEPCKRLQGCHAMQLPSKASLVQVQHDLRRICLLVGWHAPCDCMRCWQLCRFSILHWDHAIPAQAEIRQNRAPGWTHLCPEALMLTTFLREKSH